MSNIKLTISVDGAENSIKMFVIIVTLFVGVMVMVGLVLFAAVCGLIFLG